MKPTILNSSGAPMPRKPEVRVVGRPIVAVHLQDPEGVAEITVQPDITGYEAYLIANLMAWVDDQSTGTAGRELAIASWSTRCGASTSPSTSLSAISSSAMACRCRSRVMVNLLKRPVFHGQHAEADSQRLEHIMTLLEMLIESVEGLRVDLKAARQQDKW